MADVILDGYIELPTGTDRSALVTSITPDMGLEIKETRPLNSAAVKKDAGLKNNRFTIHVEDDTSYTMATYLRGAVGTKVAFLFRPDAAVAGAGNPQTSGTCIIPNFAPPVVQGETAGYDITLEVDGIVTFTDS